MQHRTRDLRGNVDEGASQRKTVVHQRNQRDRGIQVRARQRRRSVDAEAHADRPDHGDLPKTDLGAGHDRGIDDTDAEEDEDERAEALARDAAREPARPVLRLGIDDGRDRRRGGACGVVAAHG
jgi:hypothetical protein